MSITAADIKILRDRTNLPMMECKAALTEAGGDMDKAIDFLRKKYSGHEAQGRPRDRRGPHRRLHRSRAESRGHPRNALRVGPGRQEPSSSSSWPTRSPSRSPCKTPASVEALLTQPFVDDPKKTIQELIGEVYGQLREVMKPHRFARLTGLLGEYCHHDGSLGVLLQVEGDKAEPQLLRDVCMHIAARNPVSGKREDVPEEVIDKEKEIARAQAAATGKPANIVNMIAEGKMKTWFAENVLLEQPFVKDDSKSVGDLLKSNGLTLVRFLRYKVGDVN